MRKVTELETNLMSPNNIILSINSLQKPITHQWTGRTACCVVTDELVEFEE